MMNSALPRPDAERRAYFAGYFDAEGTICIAPRNKGMTWGAQITFGQTTPSVLHALQATYGGDLYAVKRQRSNWKPQTRWVLSRFGAIACFLDDIYPFLGEKREQVRIFLERFSSRMLSRDAWKLHADLTALKEVELIEKELPVEARSSAKRSKRCSMPGCHRLHRARGLCANCYQRANYNGELKDRRGKHETRVFHRDAIPSTEIAYFAGYFDGDGCLVLRKTHKTWNLVISFNQTRSEALLRLHKVYGGSLKFRPQQTLRRHQLAWRLYQRERVMQFLRDIEPFIIEKRRDVALIFTRYVPGMAVHDGTKLCEELQRDRPDRTARRSVGAVGADS